MLTLEALEMAGWGVREHTGKVVKGGIKEDDAMSIWGPLGVCLIRV